MHNPSHDCKTDHSGFPRMKPIDMSCSKMKTSVKLMTANIETDQTRSHKSKFYPFKSSPVRNRPKPWNFQIVNECAKRNFPDISKLLFHSGHSLTALSSQLLHFSSQLSSASKPSTTTRFGNLTKKPIHWEETCPLRRSCERPRQTCTTSCHSRRIPEPS